ncbi:MAG: DNA-primase RepB domain-containing protein [Rhizobiaceae bacterium]
MGESSDQNGYTAARRMLDVFASVGATRYDVTWTNADGEERAFRRNCMTADLVRTMPAMLDDAARRHLNVIVRPRSKSGITFVQLDDLKPDKLAHVAPAVFLALETSPGNFQAWAALAESVDKDVVRRFKKGAGADATASGATRIAGSLNFKAKYAPGFPRVTIHEAYPGRTTTVAELERLGLIAPPEIVAEQPAGLVSPRSRPGPGKRRWPSYERCLDGAPLNSEETGPDTSRADFVWCMTAVTWGWTAQETADRLMEESPKARTNGRSYAELTARNAALAVERRKQQPRRHLSR